MSSLIALSLSRKNFVSALLLVVLLLTTRTVLGATSVDEIVTDVLEKWGGVGLTGWSVDSEGRMCTLGVAGERIKGSNEPLQTTGDSRHHVGSVTKSMTATLLAILIETGMIENGWDAKMEELVPFAGGGGSYANVTLRQVAGMLSGLPEDIDLETVPSFDPNDIRSIRRAVTIAALQAPPANPPGTTYLYSNYAYIVLGHIIENLTNNTWEHEISERLFAPLDIMVGDDPSDFTGPPDNDLDPWGHIGDDQIPCDPSTQDCDIPAAAGPAGLYSGPVASMARYFAWHIQCHNGEIPQSDRSATLLSQKSCQEIHQPADSTIDTVYGYGWVCINNTSVGGLVCSHNGSNMLNYYNVTMIFGMDRAFVGYTNGMRSNWTDARMVHEVVTSLIFGDIEEQCDARIPSTVYTDTLPENTTSICEGTSGQSRHKVALFFFLSILFAAV